MGIIRDALKTIGDHQDSAGFELLTELGFFAADVMMLGMNYMTVATQRNVDEATLQHIEDTERTIRANLALAFCK